MDKRRKRENIGIFTVQVLMEIPLYFFVYKTLHMDVLLETGLAIVITCCKRKFNVIKIKIS